MELLLAGVPEYERAEAFNFAQPIAAVFAEYLNGYGGKRPKKKREGETEEPPLEEHERYRWLDTLRVLTPWALPDELRVAKREVSPAIAREILEALDRDWVPGWVRKFVDVPMLERTAEEDD